MVAQAIFVRYLYGMGGLVGEGLSGGRSGATERKPIEVGDRIVGFD